MSNKLKLPPINSSTKILSFDLESNGLHGQAFAIGAVVVDAGGQILDQFVGRIEINDEVDEWVAQNVLPNLHNITVSHQDYSSLIDDFWSWFVDAKEKADYVIVQNGYPVEYRFLLDCQQADLTNRYWQHPFPILDLTSLLVQAGMSQADKSSAELGHLRNKNLSKHNPLDDALVTVLLAFDVLLKTKNH